MYKIKKNRKGYTVEYDGLLVFTCTAEQLGELSNTLVRYVVGKGYVISAPDQQAKARGFGKYHYIKGFLLAVWHDFKKKYGKVL